MLGAVAAKLLPYKLNNKLEGSWNWLAPDLAVDMDKLLAAKVAGENRVADSWILELLITTVAPGRLPIKTLCDKNVAAALVAELVWKRKIPTNFW